MKVGIIINANSKQNRLMKYDPVEVYSMVGGDYVDVRLTSSLEELEDVVRDFMERRVACIGVSGGDGSLHHVMTRCMRIYGEGRMPPLLILKGGTMDNVSRSIDLRGKGPDILKRLVTDMENGAGFQLRRRDTMRIGDSYCFIFGTGFVTNFLHEAYAGKEKGMARNLQVVGKAVEQVILEPDTGSLYQGTRGRFIADGRELDIDYTSGILAGTVEYVGLGFSPLSRALERENSFHAIISAIKPRQFLKHLHRVRVGLPIEDPLHFDMVLERLVIISDGPFEYTMDGDIYTAEHRLEVQAGPRVELVYV